MMRGAIYVFCMVHIRAVDPAVALYVCLEMTFPAFLVLSFLITVPIKAERGMLTRRWKKER